MCPCSPWPSPSRTAPGEVPAPGAPQQRVALMAVGPGRAPGAPPGPRPHDVADAFPVSADVLEPICPESSGLGAAAWGSRPALAGTAEPNRVPWDHLQGTSGWGQFGPSLEGSSQQGGMGHTRDKGKHPQQGPCSSQPRTRRGRAQGSQCSPSPPAPQHDPIPQPCCCSAFSLGSCSHLPGPALGTRCFVCPQDAPCPARPIPNPAQHPWER